MECPPAVILIGQTIQKYWKSTKKWEDKKPMTKKVKNKIKDRTRHGMTKLTKVIQFKRLNWHFINISLNHPMWQF